MFEALGFRVSRDPVEPEDVRQPAFYDPVPPDDGGGGGLPTGGQLDLFAGIESQHPISGHPPKRRRNRRPANGKPIGEARAPHDFAFGANVINRLQVVGDHLRGRTGACVSVI